MKIKVLTDKVVDELVKEIAGSDVISLVKLLKDKENVSEFKLADKLTITVNQVRNMLYRLYDKNLVSFTRKKDKKKGWYIYYWTFDSKRASDLIFDIKRKKINYLREELAKERGENFFYCPNKCVRLSFTDALEIQYKCPECGQILIQEDNTKKIERIDAEIKKLEHEITTGEGIFEEKAVRAPKKKLKLKKVKKKPRAKKRVKKKPKKIKKKKKAKKIKKAKPKKFKKVKIKKFKKIKIKKKIFKKPKAKKQKKKITKKKIPKKIIEPEIAEKPKRRIMGRIFRKGRILLGRKLRREH